MLKRTCSAIGTVDAVDGRFFFRQLQTAVNGSAAGRPRGLPGSLRRCRMEWELAGLNLPKYKFLAGRADIRPITYPKPVASSLILCELDNLDPSF